MIAADLSWPEDPLPIPSSLRELPIAVGDRCRYYRKPGGKSPVTGIVTALEADGRLAKLSGHPGAFPVQIVAVRRLQRLGEAL